MRAEGLEPPRLAPPEPKSGVSANSTTPAWHTAPTWYIRHAPGRVWPSEPERAALAQVLPHDKQSSGMPPMRFAHVVVCMSPLTRRSQNDNLEYSEPTGRYVHCPRSARLHWLVRRCRGMVDGKSKQNEYANGEQGEAPEPFADQSYGRRGAGEALPPGARLQHRGGGPDA